MPAEGVGLSVWKIVVIAGRHRDEAWGGGILVSIVGSDCWKEEKLPKLLATLTGSEIRRESVLIFQ